MTDPWAHLKENRWREVAAVDARLARGEISEQQWHDAMAALIVPAYLGAETPWGQSGRTGDEAGWERSRSLLADAIDGPGTFLDVGCANGWLMESVARWTGGRAEPYGVDIAPELVALARRRLPHWTDRIWVGNALTWTPPQRFATIRAGLEYVPAQRRRDLVEHLLAHCDRLVIGVYNEQAHERPVEDLVLSWGFPVAGRSERAHATKPEMSYRALWIDA